MLGNRNVMFNKFVKEIFNETGLANEGFIHWDKRILKVPIKDFVRGYTFNKSSDRCYVSLFIQPTYFPSTHIFLSYGWRLRSSGRQGDRFNLEDEFISNTRKEIASLILQSKDVINGINDPLDFYDKFNDLSTFDDFKQVDPYHHAEMMAVTLCYARHPKALPTIDAAIKFWHTSDRKDLEWVRDIHTRLQELREACGREPEQTELYEKWKTYTFQNLHLDRLPK